MLGAWNLLGRLRKMESEGDAGTLWPFSCLQLDPISAGHLVQAEEGGAGSGRVSAPAPLNSPWCLGRLGTTGCRGEGGAVSRSPSTWGSPASPFSLPTLPPHFTPPFQLILRPGNDQISGFHFQFCDPSLKFERLSGMYLLFTGLPEGRALPLGKMPSSLTCAG